MPAKWLQDSLTGAFAICANRSYVAKQGGYEGFVPERIGVTKNGTFIYDHQYSVGKTHHYTFSNPFEHLREKNKPTLEETIKSAEDTKSQYLPKTSSIEKGDLR